MKKINWKNVDWEHLIVLGLGVIAYTGKAMYDHKRFNENLNKQYDENFEDKVSKIVDKKLKRIK